MSTEPDVVLVLPARAAVTIANDEHGRVVLEQDGHSVVVDPRDAIAVAMSIIMTAGYGGLFLTRVVEGGYIDFDENEPPDALNAGLRDTLDRIRRERERIQREFEDPPPERSAGALRQKRHRERKRNAEGVTSAGQLGQGGAA